MATSTTIPLEGKQTLTVGGRMIKQSLLLLEKKQLWMAIFSVTVLALCGIGLMEREGTSDLKILSGKNTTTTIKTTLRVEHHSLTLSSMSKNNNTPTAVIHIGPCKTATTTIQKLIVQYLDTLKDNDLYEIPGNWEKNGYQVRRNFAQCFSSDPEESKYCRNTTALKDIATIGTQQKNLLISSEYLSPERIKVGMVKQHLTTFYNIENIHIVAYYRRFYDWVISRWNQSHKSTDYYKRQTLVDYMDKDSIHSLYNNGPYVYGANKHWSGHFPKVTVHNMLAYTTKSAMVDEFFCNVIPHANSTCSKHMKRSIEDRSNLENPSRELVYDDLLFVAIRELNLTFKLPRGVQNTKMMYTLGTRVKEYHQNVLHLTQYDFDSRYKKCPKPDTLQLLLDYTLQAEQYFFPEFYNSDKGRQDILSKFERDKTTKLCTIDVVAVIRDDSRWQEFFKKLEAEHNKKHTAIFGV